MSKYSTIGTVQLTGKIAQLLKNIKFSNNKKLNNKVEGYCASIVVKAIEEIKTLRWEKRIKRN